MRAYYFGNMYLSSIQQGIQAAHVTAEMFLKYNYLIPEEKKSQRAAILDHWALEHKTMVLLNAGYSEELHSLVEFFSDPTNPLPWAHFNEGKDALDGALTCVGIVLPEEFYEAAKEIRELGLLNAMAAPNMSKLQTDWERAMAVRLNNYGLAK